MSWGLDRGGKETQGALAENIVTQAAVFIREAADVDTPTLDDVADAAAHTRMLLRSTITLVKTGEQFGSGVGDTTLRLVAEYHRAYPASDPTQETEHVVGILAMACIGRLESEACGRDVTRAGRADPRRRLDCICRIAEASPGWCCIVLNVLLDRVDQLVRIVVTTHVEGNVRHVLS